MATGNSERHSLGHQVEEMERVTFPSGAQVLVGTAKETVLEDGVWRTREHTFSAGLNCGCNTASATEIHECQRCSNLVCTRHAIVCMCCARTICPECTKVYRAEEGVFVYCNQCTRSTFKKFLAAIIEFCRQ